MPSSFSRGYIRPASLLIRRRVDHCNIVSVGILFHGANALREAKSYCWFWWWRRRRITHLHSNFFYISFSGDRPISFLGGGPRFEKLLSGTPEVQNNSQGSLIGAMSKPSGLLKRMHFLKHFSFGLLNRSHLLNRSQVRASSAGGRRLCRRLHFFVI